MGAREKQAVRAAGPLRGWGPWRGLAGGASAPSRSRGGFHGDGNQRVWWGRMGSGSGGARTEPRPLIMALIETKPSWFLSRLQRVNS